MYAFAVVLLSSWVRKRIGTKAVADAAPAGRPVVRAGARARRVRGNRHRPAVDVVGLRGDRRDRAVPHARPGAHDRAPPDGAPRCPNVRAPWRPLPRVSRRSHRWSASAWSRLRGSASSPRSALPPGPQRSPGPRPPWRPVSPFLPQEERERMTPVSRADDSRPLVSTSAGPRPTPSPTPACAPRVRERRSPPGRPRCDARPGVWTDDDSEGPPTVVVRLELIIDGDHAHGRRRLDVPSSTARGNSRPGHRQVHTERLTAAPHIELGPGSDRASPTCARRSKRRLRRSTPASRHPDSAGTVRGVTPSSTCVRRRARDCRGRARALS